MTMKLQTAIVGLPNVGRIETEPPRPAQVNRLARLADRGELGDNDQQKKNPQG